MVTCCLKNCRKRNNLDEDGYCPEHSSARNESGKCGKCNLDVSNDQSSKALQCESEKCKVWFHLQCTVIPEALYDMMNEVSEDDDAGIRWLCPGCRTKDIHLKETEVDTVESTLRENPSNGSDEKVVCHKLKHGKCAHGITGKTVVQGKVCEFSHPKVCKKFAKYGNRGRFGCKKERNCEFLHPILCQNSVRLKKCLNRKCTYQHLKGTIRKEPKATPQFPALPTLSAVPYPGVWQTKHDQRQGSMAATKQGNSSGHIPQVTPGGDFLSPCPTPNHPPELASLQLQLNNLEGLVKKVLEMSLLQHQNPSVAQYPSSYQQMFSQKC